jgi:hypothetical protein
MSDLFYHVLFRTLNGAGLQEDHYYGELDAIQRDLASDKYMEGRLAQCTTSRTMFSGAATRGAFEIDTSTAAFTNADGGMDSLVTKAFDAQDFIVISSDTNTPRLFYGSMEQPTYDVQTMRLTVRDSHYIFQRPMLPIKYAGTNVLPSGVEGTASDLKGAPKPLVLGQVFNLTPKLVNTALLVYQVDGQQGLRTGWALTVYDKRIALVAGANYVDQADMEANAPAAGQYRVWPAGGCFRLGSSPLGSVTADVNNPITVADARWTTFPAATVDNQAHSIVAAMQEWITDAYATFTPRAGPTVYVNYTPPVVGIYLDQETTGAEAINQVSMSLSAGWGPDQNQNYMNINFWQVREPGSYAVTDYHGNTPPVIALQESDVLEIQRIVSGDPDRGIPIWKVNLGYAKNYTVQSGTDVAGAAAADIAFVSQAFRYVTAEDATVKTQWPNAQVLNIDSLIVNQADAQTEANRLLALYKVRRDFLQVKVPLSDTYTLGNGAQRLPWIGQDVSLTHSRYGLAAGATLRLIGVDIDFTGRTAVLTLWK